MEMLASFERLWRIRHGQDGETPVLKHGVFLSVAASGVDDAVFRGRGKWELDTSFARTDHVEVHVQSEQFVEVGVRIANLGTASCDLCSLHLVFWVSNGRAWWYRHPKKLSLLPDTELIIVPTDLGILVPSNTRASDITHVFAVVADPILDTWDSHAAELLRAAVDHNRGIQGINPARMSRKITCWTSNPPAFSVNGNKIMHLDEAAIEVAIDGVNAGTDAGFGIHSPNPDLWIGSLMNTMNTQPFQAIMRRPVPSGEIVFYLQSASGRRFLSTGTNCQISAESSDIILLAWEDGGDNDFNDYRIRLIHA